LDTIASRFSAWEAGLTRPLVDLAIISWLIIAVILKVYHKLKNIAIELSSGTPPAFIY
jgi:hypothetical protein